LVRRQRPRARHRAPTCRTLWKRRTRRLWCASYTPPPSTYQLAPAYTTTRHTAHTYTQTPIPHHAPPARRPPTEPTGTITGLTGAVTRECGPTGTGGTKAPRIARNQHTFTHPHTNPEPQPNTKSFGHHRIKSFGHHRTKSFGHNRTKSLGHNRTKSFGRYRTKSLGHKVLRAPQHKVLRAPHNTGLRAPQNKVLRAPQHKVLRATPNKVLRAPTTKSLGHPYLRHLSGSPCTTNRQSCRPAAAPHTTRQTPYAHHHNNTHLSRCPSLS
jgi:hypothetical protein